jgi:hypothetical protein
MKRWLKILIALLVTILGIWILIGVAEEAHSLFQGSAVLSTSLPTTSLTINDKSLSLEIVTSTQDVQHGLSDRVSMPLDHGMLFVFDAPSVQRFWMYHMHFPLDMIFLRDGVVVDMVKNLPAPSTFSPIPATYTSKTEADMVLEINAGQAEAYGMKEGEIIKELKGL